MEFSVTRRLATLEDTEFALRVHHESLHDVIVKQFGVWNEKAQEKYFYDSWLPKPIEIILCDNKLCGYCFIEHMTNHIYIHELMISPEYQGRGIGTKIITDTIEKARQKNIPVRLQVLKENKAQDLYRKLGFKDIGSNETHFQMELL